MPKEVEKFDLEPKLILRCPFCDNKHGWYLDRIGGAVEVECDCGAIIEFGCDFEWGRATLNKGN